MPEEIDRTKVIAVLDINGLFSMTWVTNPEPGQPQLVPDDTSRAQQIVDRLQLEGIEVVYDREYAGKKLNDEARETIVRQCRGLTAERVLIIHDAETIIHTARLIAQAGLDKTIVLITAAKPGCMCASDVEFNFGAGLVAVMNLKPGVYTLVGTRLEPWHNPWDPAS